LLNEALIKDYLNTNIKLVCQSFNARDRRLKKDFFGSPIFQVQRFRISRGKRKRDEKQQASLTTDKRGKKYFDTIV
jgi:hypothetical protein